MPDPPRGRAVRRQVVEPVLAAGVRGGQHCGAVRQRHGQPAAHPRRAEQHPRRAVLDRQPVHGAPHLGGQDAAGAVEGEVAQAGPCRNGVGRPPGADAAEPDIQLHRCGVQVFEQPQLAGAHVDDAAAVGRRVPGVVRARGRSAGAAPSRRAGRSRARRRLRGRRGRRSGRPAGRRRPGGCRRRRARARRSRRRPRTRAVRRCRRRTASIGPARRCRSN